MVNKSLQQQLLNSSLPGANLLVHQFRQLLGLTQEQFAARMGVTLVTVNRWENGRTRPSPLAVLRIQTMLTDLSQAGPEAAQRGAQELLERYFSDSLKLELHDQSDR